MKDARRETQDADLVIARRPEADAAVGRALLPAGKVADKSVRATDCRHSEGCFEDSPRKSLGRRSCNAAG